jgi:small conductance mechanosensitive channel
LALPAAVKNPDFIETMQLMLVSSGIRFVAAIAILAIGWMLATYVKRWVDAGLKHLPLDATLKPLLSQLLRYAILIITFILVLEQFGVQTTSLIAVMGAAGLAIGLAMQGTLANVAAGVMLLILRPIRVGHFVQAGGQSGTVREIGLFTTIMVTRDQLYISIPNSAIFGSTIINYTRERLRRVIFNVPVDRCNDLDKIEKIIAEVCLANKLVLKEPPPSAVVTEIQEYSIILRVRAYARSPDYWQALYALQKDVVTALNKADVLIPDSRQAAAVRNEPRSEITAPPEEDVPETPVREMAPLADRSPH